MSRALVINEKRLNESKKSEEVFRVNNLTALSQKNEVVQLIENMEVITGEDKVEFLNKVKKYSQYKALLFKKSENIKKRLDAERLTFEERKVLRRKYLFINKIIY